MDTAWLAAHRHDPAVRIVEVDVSRAGYDDWHIDGAVLWNVYADLKDGDYRLVGADAVARSFARSGDRAGHDRRVLRLRPGHGLLAREAVRARRRQDAELLTRQLAG